MTAMSPRAPRLATPLADVTALRALQIGMWWQTERSGGLDRVYANLVEHLPAVGVEIAGLVQGPQDVSEITSGRVRSFASENAGLIARLGSIRRTMREQIQSFDPQVVAVHFALYAAMTRHELRRLPLVVHFHGPWSGEAAQEGASRSVVAAKRLVERRVYRRADRVIVLSNAFARLVSEEFGVAENRLRLVPGHVDLARFAVAETKTQARQILGWPLDRPILVSVRRLTSRMGLDRLITAMRRVVLAEPDVLLCIAGTGPLAERLQQQVAQTGLARQIRFLGFVPEGLLPLVYRAADINVVPTLALEGFGLVAAEALAAGTPSMVTPVGGLPEVVGPLSQDLVFGSTLPDSIADGLIAALRGTISLPDALACQTYAAAQFASDLAVRRTAAVYRELVDASRRPASGERGRT